jgi:Putative MetA-pathway of phenol degradation
MQRFPVLLFLALGLLGVPFGRAQTPVPPQDKSAAPIQDNSFLIEEAYNQEEGVVQHINTFMRQRHGDWLYTFTQEWPVGSQKHQLSYTLPVQRMAGHHGIGDVALNYRYQLVGDGDARVAIAPRLSLLLPTGNEKKDLGAGGVGVQLNFPLSVVLHKNLVTHWNAGMTLTPTAKNAMGGEAGTYDYNLGQSFIWLAAPTFNVLLETVYNSFEDVVGPGRKERMQSLFLNPGIRWAYNFRSGLQIVPGIAVPVGIGPSHGDLAIFVYLSFEHPFRKPEK